MYYISSLFGYKSTIIQQPVNSDPPSAENPILNLFKKNVPQHDEFFESTNPNSLQWMKKTLLKAGLKENHGYLKAIDLVLLKMQQATGPMLYSRIPVIGPVCLPSSPMQEASYNKFVQSSVMNIEETKNELANIKEPIDEIELHDVNDELLDLIIEKFPKLTALRILGGIADTHGPWMDFTDKGLLSIGKLLFLQKFELSAWDDLVSISSAGLKNVLSQLAFTKGLTELKLNTFHAIDESIAPIATYGQLTTLSIQSAWITPRGLAGMLQSPLLKSSLSNLHLYNSTGFETSISDNVLKELESYSHLEHLLIEAAPWKVSSISVQELLAKKNTLKTLVLNGTIINDDIAKEIGNMNELEHLELFNCADVTADNGLPQLLNSKGQLRHLGLQRISHLKNEQFTLIGDLKALESLSLSSPIFGYVSNDGLKLLCESEGVQNNLHTLHLKDFPEIKSEGFIYLSQLQGLSNLRLDGCPWFNDSSLESLAKSPIKDTMLELELNKTAISDDAIFTFMRFENLRNLTLASCYGLTDRGKRLFFSDPFLQRKLSGLCLDNFDLPDEIIIEEFPNFEVLKVLIVSNSSLSEKGQKSLFDLAKDKKWLINISFGETGYLRVFEEALKAVQDSLITV